MADYYKDIGAQLKARRLEHKRELKDIAEDTKVSEEYILAIEAGNIDAFPSTVYYNLFARSYARELGFDPDRLFAFSPEESREMERLEAIGPDDTGEEPEDEESTEGKSLKKLIIWLSAVVLVIFAAVIIFIIYGNNKMLSSGNFGPGGVAEDSTLAKEPENDIFSDSLLSKPVYGDILPPKMRLRVDVTELSWVYVMADGDTALNRTLDSGDYRIIRAQDQFLISLGNPSGVSFSINDTLLKPFSESIGIIRNIEINRRNKEIFFVTSEEPVEEDSTLGQY
jgi:transcriptional regulator with XRE-family HTH domain